MATILKVGIKVADLEVNDKGYANINVAINDEVNQWNQNASAWNVQSKEDRESKAPRKYVGNGSVVFTNDEGVTKVEYKAETTNADFNKDRGGDDLPF